MTVIIKFVEDICEVWTNKPSNLYEVLKKKSHISLRSDVMMNPEFSQEISHGLLHFKAASFKIVCS